VREDETNSDSDLKIEDSNNDDKDLENNTL
jgi:hypothetical protein